MTNSSENKVNLRNIVLNLLMETETGAKSHIILKKELDKQQSLDKNERAFITRLYQGTLERKIELDFIINRFSKIKTEKMKPVILQILRMSVYQLKYMDNVPTFAVCNEAVKLTNKRKLGNLKGFVNGVLRNIDRNLKQVKYPNDENEYLSVKYSIPKWIVELWNDEYGHQKTKEILNHLYDEREITLRCNTSKKLVDEIKHLLEEEGAYVKKIELYQNSFRVSGYDTLEKLDAFKNGYVTVQDLSSTLACVAASPKKEDYIIDVCAAPGGKSICLADMMNQTGIVDARDLTEYKTNLIEDNIKRMDFQNIKVKVWDATVLDETSIEKADIVVADLPCSGLGVLSRKSDIKYHITKEQICDLSKLQKEILSVVSRYVKPGGKLIFSTCTVNKKENDENVKWIEEQLPFTKLNLEGILPNQLNVRDNSLQIFPGEFGMDGFFIAAFEREN